MSSTDTTISARHAEIARRYDRHDAEQRRGKRRRYSVAALRIGELKKFARHKWGHEIPEEAEGGRVWVRVLANSLAALVGDPKDRIRDAINLWAPWIDEDEVDEIVEMIDLSPTSYSADSVARAIELDSETRRHLNIRTIGAVDCLVDEREDLRRAKGRAREAKRRAKMRVAKAHRMNLSEVRPWDAIGISRSSFYRHRDLYERMLDMKRGD
jgi:hypothetical protein